MGGWVVCVCGWMGACWVVAVVVVVVVLVVVHAKGNGGVSTICARIVPGRGKRGGAVVLQVLGLFMVSLRVPVVGHATARPRTTLGKTAARVCLTSGFSARGSG